MNEDQINEILNQGIQDAISAVDLGEGSSLEHLIHYHYMKTQEQDKVHDLTYGDFLQAKMNGDYDLEEFTMKTIEDHPSYIEY